jgi:enterochelin esterase-like enzyme
VDTVAAVTAASHPTCRAVRVPARGLGGDVVARLWSPEGACPEALPLLVVHDGPEYEAHAGLTALAGRLVADGRLPPHRIALLDSGEREEWYSASAAYGRALTEQVVPALRAEAPANGPPAGLGASLGALALLHAERRRPGTFAALLLQSGSFFVPRFDRHESAFRRYGRIVRFVRAVRRAAGPHPHPVPVTLTCGAGEENVHNNRLMADALSGQGYDVTLHEVAGLHDYDAWRDALDPHLVALLSRVWSGAR